MAPLRQQHRWGSHLLFVASLWFLCVSPCHAEGHDGDRRGVRDSEGRHGATYPSSGGGQEDDVVTLWEALAGLSFRRAGSIAILPPTSGPGLMLVNASADDAASAVSAVSAASAERRRLAAAPADSWEPTVLEQIEVVLFALLSPFVLLNGQDLTEVIQAFNGLVVGGIGALFVKVTTVGEFKPLTLVDIAVTAMAAFTTATSSLQNPEVGVRVQGAIIFKMITSNIVEALYLGFMQDLGGCQSVSARSSVEFPRGLPLDCTRRVKLPSGEIRGETFAQWMILIIEYGIAAVGAVVSPWLALIICIFNSASMGANMLLAGLFRWVVLWGKWGKAPQAKVDEMYRGLQGACDVLFFIFMGLSFLWQLGRRLLRKKGRGQGPYLHWRFRALQARGGSDAPSSSAPWACVSGLRLRFHQVDVELPEGCDTPPKQGEQAWLVSFTTPVSLTHFAFVTAGEPGTVVQDPVGWVLEASSDTDPEKASWACLHAASASGSVPRARNARTPWFQLAPTAAPAASSQPSVVVPTTTTAAQGPAVKGDNHTTEVKCEDLADAEAKPPAGPNLRSEAGHSAAPADQGGAEAPSAGTRAVAIAVKADAPLQPDAPVPATRHAARSFGCFEKLQQWMSLVIAPIMVLNHVIKELSDTTAGKDVKRLRALASDALVELGWEERVYRKQLEVAIRLLLKGAPIKPDMLQRIVKSADDEDLKTLAKYAANQQFAEFAKHLREVLRKLEENVPDLVPPLKEVRAKLDLGLREYFMARAADQIAREFFKSQLRARLMLMTLQTITKPDGTVVQQGRLKELLGSRRKTGKAPDNAADSSCTPSKKAPDEVPATTTSDGGMDKTPDKPLDTTPDKTPEKTPDKTSDKAPDGSSESGEAAELLKFLEQLASGRPYPGRVGEVAKMEVWLVENFTAYKEHMKAQSGRCGGALVSLLPLLDLPPRVRKLATQGPETLSTAAQDGLQRLYNRLFKRRASGQAPATQTLPSAARTASGGAAGPDTPSSPKVAWSDVEVPARSAPALRPEGQHAAAPPAESPAAVSAAPGSPAPSAVVAPAAATSGLDAMESRALRLACEEELSAKLGLTREQARRLAGLMDEATRSDIGATGNVDLLKVRLLADRHGISFNQAKAVERQTSVQKFRLEKELERDLPAWSGPREAAKKANNMTPAAISARMSQPEDARPPNPPDTREIVEGLEEKVKKLEEERSALQKQVEELQAKVKELEERPPAAPPETASQELKLEEPEEWAGFYVQGEETTDMTFDSLAIKSDGTIVGGGRDAVGDFTVKGRREGDKVTFEKSYIGKHTVQYEGKLTGQTIDGMWMLGDYNGAFQLRRK